MNKETLSRAAGIVKNPRAVAGIMAVSTLALLASACGGAAAQASFKPTWITPQVSGKTVNVPVSEIEKDTMTHFRIPAASGGTLTFMAYNLDGVTYARANVCPPCRSIGFTLVGKTLVCNSCGTVFDAKTGDGISGACVSYPKADVPFQVSNGNLIMNADEMNTAYQNTIVPGRP